MVRIQVEMSAEDQERFAAQAQREGKTLDAWLVKIARQHVAEPDAADDDAPDRFESIEELMDFLEECRANSGLEREPDWEEHLRNINDSRIQGLPGI